MQTRKAALIRAIAHADHPDWGFVFCTALDANNEALDIAGETIPASEALRKLRPKAYNALFEEWLGSLSDREVVGLDEEFKANS